MQIACRNEQQCEQALLADRKRFPRAMTAAPAQRTPAADSTRAGASTSLSPTWLGLRSSSSTGWARPRGPGDSPLAPLVPTIPHFTQPSCGEPDRASPLTRPEEGSADSPPRPIKSRPFPTSDIGCSNTSPRQPVDRRGTRSAQAAKGAALGAVPGIAGATAIGSVERPCQARACRYRPIQREPGGCSGMAEGTRSIGMSAPRSDPMGARAGGPPRHRDAEGFVLDFALPYV